jgi:hypothetical protein
MTKAQLISDVELSANQGHISDDSNLDWTQLAFWATTHLNSLVSSECNAAIKAGKQIPAVYKQVAALEVAVVEDGHEEDRLYIELDDEVLSLIDDAGVILVETEDGDEIPPVSLERHASIKKMRFAKPSTNRPLYYRRGEKIFLLGFKEVDIPFEKATVYYVPRQDVYTMADTAEILATDTVRDALIASLIEQAKQVLYGTQIDQTNDGVDPKTPVYHRQIQNPDQPPAQ